MLNIKCEEHPADLLWQIRVVTEPYRWVTVACPFSDLVLTRRGRVELNQLPLSRESVNGVRGALPSLCISVSCPATHTRMRLLTRANARPYAHTHAHMSSPFFTLASRVQWGMLLADGMNGPFKFEVQHIRALRDFDPAVYANESAQLLAASQRRQLQPRTSNSVQNASSSAAAVATTTVPAAASGDDSAAKAAAATGQVSTSGAAPAAADAVADNLGAVRDKEYYRLLREKARLA